MEVRYTANGLPVVQQETIDVVLFEWNEILETKGVPGLDAHLDTLEKKVVNENFGLKTYLGEVAKNQTAEGLPDILFKAFRKGSLDLYQFLVYQGKENKKHRQLKQFPPNVSFTVEGIPIVHRETISLFERTKQQALKTIGLDLYQKIKIAKMVEENPFLFDYILESALVPMVVPEARMILNLCFFGFLDTYTLLDIQSESLRRN